MAPQPSPDPPLDFTRPTPLAWRMRVQPDVARMIEAPTGRACRACGIVLRLHVRCSRCGLLIGPGHEEQQLVSGVCSSCYAYVRDRRGRGDQARPSSHRITAPLPSLLDRLVRRLRGASPPTIPQD